MFVLNTQSGMLHLDDHGGGANAEEFDRADEADQFMHSQHNKKMTFCKSCFPGNRNSVMAEEMAKMEADLAPSDEKTSGSPTETTTARGTTPPRVIDPTADGRA
jgi:hypothetical protein